MYTGYYRFLRKLASIGYTAGVLSLIIGILLSAVNQPVYASSQNTNNGGDKIWICHVPPGNPNNAQALYVDANGWNGHDGHALDFQITGEHDPRCGGSQDPTHTPYPTKTHEPTEVHSTNTQAPTVAQPTNTQVPTEVQPTNTQVPTEVQPTDTQVPTEVKVTETQEPTVGQEPTSTPTATVAATEDHKIWICHIPPGNPDNPLALNVDANGWNGHDGHPADFIIDSPDDPRCAPSTATPTSTATVVVGVTQTPEDTLTATPTETPTELPTATETATATATATETATPTATEVSFERLNVKFECVNGQQLWTITNPNSFPVDAAWSFSSGPGPGSATIPANSSLNFYVAGGYRTITVNWNEGENPQSLSLTTSPTSPCAVNSTSTPTQPSGDKDPTATPATTITIHRTSPSATPRPTFVSTLEAAANPSQEVLIPVTGADFSNPFTNTPLSSLFLNFGFVFLGLAFLAHGVSFKLK
jgi:hypothetical protein